MDKRFIVVSGLPGSGKSTLGGQVARELGLPMLDKDDILEALFESKGTGDARWRRVLSREADVLLQAAAIASKGAVLVSHWHLPGMAVESGTPVDWLTQLPGRIVHLHCVCPVEVAGARFVGRKRHPGHCDGARSDAEILASIAEVSQMGHLDIGTRVDVDTSNAPDLSRLLQEVRS